ncbi:hypothetical protein [Metamycoplasma auris]|uniref:Uncharacterized protein n=1 Tax=Metamycoplasma auris TaxID=51363 RepID=A0A2W7FXH8_9BACT|nr:hypothetical protein [Metamycoplasma auris]PZV98696.1 hypothetical protein BCF89_1164 [Metamycoplasma auris]
MTNLRQFQIAKVFFPLVEKIKDYTNCVFEEISELSKTCYETYINISVEYLETLSQKDFKKIMSDLFKDVKLLDKLWDAILVSLGRYINGK